VLPGLISVPSKTSKRIQLYILCSFSRSVCCVAGGVGFDINCGVRLIRTNLTEKDVAPVKEQLAQSLFDHIPVGVGSKGIIPMGARDLEEALEMGMDWSLREGYAWAEDKEHCEEYGRMLQADPSKVSSRAKKRGLPQLGTLGAGNHYAEIQVVEEIYDDLAAYRMGVEQKGQVYIPLMICELSQVGNYYAVLPQCDLIEIPEHDGHTYMHTHRIWQELT
jgi:hypothetical protein